MLVGSKIGPFTIEKELGSGAMGTVYRAKFQKDDEKAIPVALKVVSLGLLGNDGAMARFEREASILKQLRHPHIVRLLATGRYQKTPFIAMEYVDGESLDKGLALRGRLGWEDVVALGKQLCDALQHAHEKGIVHRDLKPSNLMVTRGNILKLTDFGIAKDTDVTALTGANSTIGTAAYMSPEQCKGDRNLGPKSDLYSLGVVLYELATGQKPFTAESSVDMFLKHVNETPVRPVRLVPDLPIWLDNLIMFLMEKEKDRRPMDAATVGKMLGDIEQKVQAQQSLGAEVANARRGDRQVGSTVDAEDMAIAKSLRAATGGGKKKKKKKSAAKSKKVLFQAVGLGILLIGIVAFAVYMLKPESLDAAYAKVEAAPADGKLAAVIEFLHSHGTANDPRVEQAKTVYREAKVRETETVLANKFGSKFQGNSGKFDEEPYKAAILAMEAEKAGELKRAVEHWAAAKEKSKTPDPAKLTDEDETNRAVLAWVAEKRLKDIQQGVPDNLKRLAKQIADERLYENAKTYEAANPEGHAVRALRLEQFGDKAKAKSAWEALVSLAEKEADQRVWQLLAAQQAAQITLAKGSEDAVKTERLSRLEERMKKLETDAGNVKDADNAPVLLREIRNGCRDIIALYDDEPGDPIKGVVAWAKKLLDENKKS